MSPIGSLFTGYGGRFPRVSGDEPATEAVLTCTVTFSPRERG